MNAGAIALSNSAVARIFFLPKSFAKESETDVDGQFYPDPSGPVGDLPNHFRILTFAVAAQDFITL